MMVLILYFVLFGINFPTVFKHASVQTYFPVLISKQPEETSHLRDNSRQLINDYISAPLSLAFLRSRYLAKFPCGLLKFHFIGLYSHTDIRELYLALDSSIESINVVFNLIFLALNLSQFYTDGKRLWQQIFSYD